MGYTLGIDLGTTFSAAAIHRGDRVEIVQLGSHGAAIPSVVVLRADNTVLTGEAAERRAATEPERVAREFKRRLGDSTPLILGGSPQSVEAVMARLLRSVVDQVTQLEGAPPDHVTLTHPANWGEFKLDLLRQAIRMANLPDTSLVTEPEAAARHYASQSRVPDGATVAVYDLGGGTFDAAVLRKQGDDFVILGEPEGIERLGGIDFDAAVIAHVRNEVGPDLDALAPTDPAASRLRAECVSAKEALSADLDVTIPVLLPSGHREVRLTRTEFEHAIRPSVEETVAALQRAVASAGVEPDDLHAVLLVGGSSRIPLVADVVANTLGRPVAVDAHPKHVVAMGAAALANQSAGAGPTEPAAAAASGATAPEPSTPAAASLVSDGDGSRPRVGVALAALVVIAAAAVAGFLLFRDTGDGTTAGDETAIVDPGGEGSDPDDGVRDGDDPGESGGDSETVVDDTTTTTTTAPTTSTTTSTTTTTTTTTAPPFGVLVCDTEPCAEMLSVEIVEGELLIDWVANGFTPDTNGNHAHFFWSTYETAQAGSGGGGSWELTDQIPFVPSGEMRAANRPADADICVTAANSGHAVIDATNSHCVPFPAG